MARWISISPLDVVNNMICAFGNSLHRFDLESRRPVRLLEGVLAVLFVGVTLSAHVIFGIALGLYAKRAELHSAGLSLAIS